MIDPGGGGAARPKPRCAGRKDTQTGALAKLLTVLDRSIPGLPARPFLAAPVKKISETFLVCVIGGLSACGRGEAVVEPVDAVPVQQERATIDAPQITDVNTPEGYLLGACYDDLYLVAAAKAIKARSPDPRIRALADSLETEHRELLATGSALLADLGGAPAPSRLSARHASYVADLDAAAPQELDQLWLAQQLTVLLESSLLHTTFSLRADDPRLKAHALAASLSAQNHLDEVRRLGGDKLRPLDA